MQVLKGFSEEMHERMHEWCAKNKQVPEIVAFASRKHKDQRRKNKDKTPYINHPIRVAEILSECGVGDPVTLSVAYLHDTVEDTDTTIEEITQMFGAEIATTVSELTDDKSLPREKRKALQIEHGPHLSIVAQRVKIADKIANIEDLRSDPPVGWDLKRIDDYIKHATAVVDAIPLSRGSKLKNKFYSE
jgi:(p)ppGpp synthase/HD superfamily hydrolase